MKWKMQNENSPCITDHWRQSDMYKNLFTYTTSCFCLPLANVQTFAFYLSFLHWSAYKYSQAVQTELDG